ncbi:MAG: ATP-grasp domain protein [Candidatus Moranbacteria bacterium GW2011_GWE1_36_7]|nr:MAG: ATP-grasp domain protein [Candidatus Moranbacteria bacterium GW2011_GWD2_36_12]KKQ06733.1 MAG: ATP-grasp domain protein [Candidatus Moranbacteria bacterium GW2011_GWE2_36_40]KKQ14771.1 MAG: ATP-grasp domain protein [Candidatus Moranbacteria bacterium GW2011_GWE1_36_7]
MQKESKNIVVIYTGSDWDMEVPISYEQTRKAFERWHMMALEKNIQMYRASVEWYDIEKNVFIRAWAFRDGKWRRIEKDITPDLIYDKTPGSSEHKLFDLKMAMASNSIVFNSPLFRTMVDSKLSQYALFSEYMPKTVVAMNSADLKNAIEEIKTSKIVAKPLQGSGGFGIVIGDKETILKEKFIYPMLLQEFVKNENGIPGFSEKGELADLRITYINHQPLYALSRIAQGGSLFTNMHQGATSKRVPLEKIPPSVWEVTEKIVVKLKMFAKAQYSLDFFFDEKGKPFFIEMNTVPGLCLIEDLKDPELQQKDFDAFVEMLPRN